MQIGRRVDAKRRVRSARRRNFGRDPATLPISIFRVPDDIDRLRLCEQLGIDRVVFSLPAEKEDKLMPILDRWAELKHQLAAG